jgi:hypothetical protein
MAVVKAPLLQGKAAPDWPCIHPGINKVEPARPNLTPIRMVRRPVMLFETCGVIGSWDDIKSHGTTAEACWCHKGGYVPLSKQSRYCR